jgi:hypothetical protein
MRRIARRVTVRVMVVLAQQPLVTRAILELSLHQEFGRFVCVRHSISQTLMRQPVRNVMQAAKRVALLEQMAAQTASLTQS